MYVFCAGIFCVLTIFLLPFRWLIYRPRTAVHIGENSHLHRRYVDALRSRGEDAAYLSIGETNAVSNDLHLAPLRQPWIAAIRDHWVFWTYLSSFAVIHAHRGIGLSHYQWEYMFLRLIGRRVVVHFRGCEARNRDDNIRLHPEHNICQNCDYSPDYLCMSGEARRRRWVARHLAHTVIVTTPDMLDFWPRAKWIPFLQPETSALADTPAEESHGAGLKLVHVTNQPGIEGTHEIIAAVEKLKKEGIDISLEYLNGQPHSQVLAAMTAADATIGKLKMGYYANAQVEGLSIGVPAITWVRDEFISKEIADGGFIICPPGRIIETLRRIVDHPDILAHARGQATASAEALHNEADIVQRTLVAYGWRSG